MPCTMMARRPKVSTGIEERIRDKVIPIIRNFQVQKNNEIEKNLKSFQNKADSRLKETEAAMIQAQYQAQKERLELMKQQTQLIQEVSGLSEEVMGLSDSINPLSAFLKQQEQRSVMERQQILNGIEDIKELARENQGRLEKNARMLKEGMEAVLNGIQDLEKRRKLEEMSSAAHMIDQVVQLRAEVAAETIELFRDPHYDQSQKDLDQAQRLFKLGRFQAARELAGNAYLIMSGFIVRAKKQQAQFENEREMALESLTRLDGLINSLDNDVGRAWFPGEIDDLKKRRAALESLSERGTTEAYIRLKDTADDMQHQALKLGEKIEARVQQDETRMELMEHITRSLESMLYHTKPPILEKFHDLNSDLLLLTEEGLKVAMGIEGELVLNFENPQDTVGNQEKLKQLGHFLTQNEADRIEIDFEHIPHDRMIREGPYMMRKPADDLRKKLLQAP